MPGWHEATKQYLDDGRVQTVGIIQEQHADRCRLFMQWKDMDWPIMVDSLNLLEVKAVPLTFLIDEHGVIVKRPRRPGEVEAWLDEPAPTGNPPALATSRETTDGQVKSRMEAANDLFLWGRDDQARDAVTAYQLVLKSNPDDPLLHFRLGVAHRKNFDVDSKKQEEFQLAVAHWQTALDGDPNQYIWRRRIQQYGPRLMKPYPFYDWVPTAREEIAARGETPVKLAVEPSGAEYAQPERSFSASKTAHENPDPEGRIDRDVEGYISAKAVVVPSVVKPGGAVRVHVLMSPNEAIKAHWNNEVDDTVLWIDPPGEWLIDTPRLVAARPKTIVSTETRRMEFELHVPAGTEPGVHRIPAYALYYVCEDVGGACLYRRQDLEIEVTVVE